MDNPQEVKKVILAALIEKGDYAGAARLQEEIEEKPQKPRVKIVSKGGTNTNVVKKMIDVALAGIGAGTGTSDHGALTGLADDDHTQYLNNARGDARYYTQSQINTSLSGKADTVHTHTKSQITDFSEADYATAIHTHVISDTTGLQTALDGKADDAHTHIIADTTGLQAALDGKAATSHAHIIGDVTGLQTALDGKAATSHTHVIGDISGLGTALAGKVDTNVAITGATKTKVTYDAKGLVTDGADATTADIADSSNKRYVTDAQLTVIGNTSGTNTGDNAVNTLYSGLVSNATHTGDATGATDLTVVKIQGKDFPTLSAADDQKYPKYVSGSNAFVMTAIAGGGDALVANPLSQFAATTSLQLKGVISDETGSGALVFADAPTLNDVVLGAGDATTAPLQLTSGTLQTTPSDGAIEMDGDCFYGTTDGGNRGVIRVEHIIRADATRTFTSNTSQQAIFTTPANGTLTLETGTYLFEGLIAMTSMSATSGNGKFSLIGAGTATLNDILWQAYGNDNAAETTGAAIGGSWHVIATQTAANIATAATGTALAFLVKGTFSVTVAGTIIPSFAQTTAAAAVVSIGSYIKFNRIGSTTMTSVGQWT